MKPKRARLAVFVLGWLLWMVPIAAAAAACGTMQYYAPSDLLQERPLSAPHPEFRGFAKRARSGDPVAQRSFAVLFDIGYLVDPCEGEARRWYERAAAGGDEIARRWVARFKTMEEIRQGPECAGRHCAFARFEGVQSVELYANANGSFTVPVTIGGVSTTAVVDTGASHVSMSARQARAMGIDYGNGEKVVLMTANGSKQAVRVLLPAVEAGGIVLRDVLGTVSDVEMPVLLGMSYLGRLNVTINQRRMILSRP